jgi:hypothetical protein
MYISFIEYWVKYFYYYLLGFLPEITYDIEIDHTDKFLKIISNELERLVYIYIYRYVIAYITIFYIQPEWVFSCTMTLIIIGPSVVKTMIELIILIFVIIWYGTIIVLNYIKIKYKFLFINILNKINNIFILINSLNNIIKNIYFFIYYYLIDFLIYNNFIIKKGLIKQDIYGNDLILIKKTNIFFIFSLYLFNKLSSYLYHLINFRVDWRTMITYSSSDSEGEPEITKDGRSLEDHMICFPSIEGLKYKHKIKKLKLKKNSIKLFLFKNKNKSIKYGLIRKFKFYNFLINKSFFLFILKNYKNISILLVFSSFIFILIINFFVKFLNFFNFI